MTRHANAARDLAAILAAGSPEFAEGNAATLAALEAEGRAEIAAVLRQTQQESPLAAKFETLWVQLDGPELVKEFRFHPVRQWRADYCHEATRALVELEGGLYSRGRHSRAAGMQDDIDKYNAAQMLGYVVLRLGTGQVDAVRVSAIIEFIRSKGG